MGSVAAVHLAHDTLRLRRATIFLDDTTARCVASHVRFRTVAPNKGAKVRLPRGTFVSGASAYGTTLLIALLLLLGAPPRVHALVCGDGILDGSEECDPNCGTPGSPVGCPLHPNGDPDLGTCASGTDCFRRFTCCKFNCQFVGTAVPCADGNDCTTNDVCNMVGQCLAGSFASPGTACNDPTATQCDLADTCNGSGTCLQNLVAAGTTADTFCTDGNECTLNQCNGTGGCQNPFSPGGATCGDPTGTECNLPDACNGAGTCLPNLVPAGTTANVLCTDGNECTLNQCNGAGGCQNPSSPGGTPCGDPTVTECTAADTCNGSGTCTPNNAPAGTPAETLCADASTCTFNQCNGSGGCQNPNKPDGSECRPIAGPCDVAEQCGGGICPGDGKVSPGTECRPSTDVCDPNEVCDGVGSACPADLKLPDGTPCRASAGECDLAEECSGGSCPADAKSSAECRPSTDVCDPAESCDGVGDTCPADIGFDDGASCDDGNDCTVAGTCTSQVCVPLGPGLVLSRGSLVFREAQVNMGILVDDARGTLSFYRNVFMADGTKVTANRVRLFAGTSAYDVDANHLENLGTVRGTYTPAYAPSGASAFCTATAFACGGPNVLVQGAGATLPPGSYGAVEVDIGATLTVTSGVYELCSLRFQPNATLTVEAGAASPLIRVEGSIRGARFVTIGAGLGTGRPSFEITGKRAAFARGANISAHLAAPFGVLRFGRELIFDGTLCARRITAFREAELGCVP